MSSSIDIPAEQVKPSMDVRLGGADKGTVKVEGPLNMEVIKTGAPIEIPDLTGTYKPGADGTSTLSPGVLTISALGTTTTCTPSNSPGPALTLDVTAAGGGSSSGNTQSGTDSGGSLPQTGPDDSAIALGTFGGTVLLAGAAGALWITRRNQAARVRR